MTGLFHPAVSIIVPVYRTPPDMLERLLQSACAQSLAELELIAVDDSSPDACPALLDAAATADSRIKVLHRKANGGAGAARNDGLAAARGEFVLFADADDALHPELCARLVDLARRAPADVVACGWRQCDAQGVPRAVTRFVPRRYALDRESERVRCLETLNVPLWNKLIRRQIVADLRFESFEATIGEDFVFLVAALCRSRAASTTDFCGYDYTEHTQSSTGRSAKGLPYLRALLQSLEAVRGVLAAAGGGAMTDRYLDRMALERFATGCDWISAGPAVEREALWDFWRGAFTRSLRPGLSRRAGVAALSANATLAAGPRVAGRITRLACAMGAPRARRDRRTATP